MRHMNTGMILAAVRLLRKNSEGPFYRGDHPRRAFGNLCRSTGYLANL